MKYKNSFYKKQVSALKASKDFESFYDSFEKLLMRIKDAEKIRESFSFVSNLRSYHNQISSAVNFGLAGHENFIKNTKGFYDSIVDEDGKPEFIDPTVISNAELNMEYMIPFIRKTLAGQTNRNAFRRVRVCLIARDSRAFYSDNRIFDEIMSFTVGDSSSPPKIHIDNADRSLLDGIVDTFGYSVPIRTLRTKFQGDASLLEKFFKKIDSVNSFFARFILGKDEDWIIVDKNSKERVIDYINYRIKRIFDEVILGDGQKQYKRYHIMAAIRAIKDLILMGKIASGANRNEYDELCERIDDSVFNYYHVHKTGDAFYSARDASRNPISINKEVYSFLEPIVEDISSFKFKGLILDKLGVLVAHASKPDMNKSEYDKLVKVINYLAIEGNNGFNPRKIGRTFAIATPFSCELNELDFLSSFKKFATSNFHPKDIERLMPRFIQEVSPSFIESGKPLTGFKNYIRENGEKLIEGNSEDFKLFKLIKGAHDSFIVKNFLAGKKCKDSRFNHHNFVSLNSKQYKKMRRLLGLVPTTAFSCGTFILNTDKNETLADILDYISKASGLDETDIVINSKRMLIESIDEFGLSAFESSSSPITFIWPILEVYGKYITIPEGMHKKLEMQEKEIINNFFA